MRRRFINMYLTTTISITLVLSMVGVGCILLLSADNAARQVKQNVAMDVVISQHADSTDEAKLDQMLASAPFCQSRTYISREQALEDHIQALGEDPTKFLGFNPLLASYHVEMNEGYATEDSLRVIAERLQKLEMVDQVIYPEQMVGLMDRYIGRTMMGVLICALLLLLVAWALIMNTIRLQIYSNRFLINTMTLVGATAWHVRRPFVRRSVVIGLIAATLTTMLLAAVIYTFRYRWGIELFGLTIQNVGFILAVIYGTAIIMTLLAAFLATSRYIRMKTSTLYEI